jgi:cobalt transporter subunit CbtB
MTTTNTMTAKLSVSQRMIAGLFCTFIGLSTVFLSGFSDISAAHNAAHDTRHSIGFPCH